MREVLDDYPDLERDDVLAARALSHDGCTIATTHVGNAGKVAKSGDR